MKPGKTEHQVKVPGPDGRAGQDPRDPYDHSTRCLSQLVLSNNYIHRTPINIKTNPLFEETKV